MKMCLLEDRGLKRLAREAALKALDGARESFKRHVAMAKVFAGYLPFAEDRFGRDGTVRKEAK